MEMNSGSNKITAARIRGVLQRCTYWADAASNPESEEWKKARHYAEQAKRLYSRLSLSQRRTANWSAVEKKILEKGYPSVTTRVLWEDEVSQKVCVLDPIEKLENDLLEIKLQNHALQKQLADLRHQVEYLEQSRNTMQTEHEREAKRHLHEKQSLLREKENLEDDLHLSQRNHRLFESRTVKKIQEYDRLAFELQECQQRCHELQIQAQEREEYRKFIERVATLLTDEQRHQLSDFVE